MCLTKASRITVRINGKSKRARGSVSSINRSNEIVASKSRYSCTPITHNYNKLLL